MANFFDDLWWDWTTAGDVAEEFGNVVERVSGAVREQENSEAIWSG